ncbi:hypothetical protein EK21DRAFT_112378 [Setomelanomma holmii]|uniref:Uncharacterized protein n=1 Tax=Setomelanomma holmii TaxID=210430 RepID=A0A9P4LM55_9PLEO|nr:hypothetical protein EK21DRAFT_112378 [Setomelanomma holmii]
MIVLENAKLVMVMFGIEGYRASLELRKYFVRQGQDISPSILNDPVESVICDLLKAIVESSDKAWIEIRFRIDLLETFMRKNDKNRGLPWYHKIHLHAFGQKDDYYEGLWDAFHSWIKVFGSPWKSDSSRFDCPEDESKSKKKTIDPMCRAEANLDTFWRSADADLTNIANVHAQSAIRQVLDRIGDMKRTKSWSERHQAVVPKTLADEDLYNPEPLSHAFHDASKEITGNFEKTMTSTKGKEKTPGDPAAADAQAEPERDPSPEPARTYKINKKSYGVFTQLYHAPDANEVAQGEVKWQDLVNALIDLGFSAESTGNVQWQFDPSKEMGLKKGIRCHSPHPRSTLTRVEARRFGARLKGLRLGYQHLRAAVVVADLNDLHIRQTGCIRRQPGYLNRRMQEMKHVGRQSSNPDCRVSAEGSMEED